MNTVLNQETLSFRIPRTLILAAAECLIHSNGFRHLEDNSICAIHHFRVETCQAMERGLGDLDTQKD